MIIAVDGPAASGKGTLAKRLAAHYGLMHLDTGALYRAVARDVLAAGKDPADEAAAAAAARGLDASTFADPALRTRGMGEAASIVARMPAVRAVLLEYQRGIAASPRGAVLDGRDIGTVVCPHADVKLFVTASSAERARRRHAELQASGSQESFQEVLADIEARDARDRERAASPLKQAADAHLLDTTNLDIEAAFRAAVEIIDTAA
ncbi:MAG: (d)CMP kinase [Hyphomicrobiales bacterium]